MGIVEAKNFSKIKGLVNSSKATRKGKFVVKVCPASPALSMTRACLCLSLPPVRGLLSPRLRPVHTTC